MQLATKALDKVRRQVWQELRRLSDQDAARRFKGARWALLKNPADLTGDQAATLRKLKRKGGELWRAYALKGATGPVLPSTTGSETLGSPVSERRSLELVQCSDVKDSLGGVDGGRLCPAPAEPRPCGHRASQDHGTRCVPSSPQRAKSTEDLHSAAVVELPS